MSDRSRQLQYGPILPSKNRLSILEVFATSAWQPPCNISGVLDVTGISILASPDAHSIPLFLTLPSALVPQTASSPKEVSRTGIGSLPKLPGQRTGHLSNNPEQKRKCEQTPEVAPDRARATPGAVTRGNAASVSANIMSAEIAAVAVNTKPRNAACLHQQQC